MFPDPRSAISFWVDGYFEETNLGAIREGDPASIKLMGYSQIVRGHVGSLARGINVANAQPDGQGLATVNPIFTWMRLAQRIPLRSHTDQVPEGVVLSAGMTARVQLDPRLRTPAKRSRHRYAGRLIFESNAVAAKSAARLADPSSRALLRRSASRTPFQPCWSRRILTFGSVHSQPVSSVSRASPLGRMICSLASARL